MRMLSRLNHNKSKLVVEVNQSFCSMCHTVSISAISLAYLMKSQNALVCTKSGVSEGADWIAFRPMKRWSTYGNACGFFSRCTFRVKFPQCAQKANKANRSPLSSGNESIERGDRSEMMQRDGLLPMPQS